MDVIPTYVKIDFNISWYTVLGVEPSAARRSLTMAYRKLCLRVHPDKGGSAFEFQRVLFIYEALMNDQSRKRYDSCGAAAFAKDFPKEDPAPQPEADDEEDEEDEEDTEDEANEEAAEPTGCDDFVAGDPSECVVRMSPVNKKLIEEWANKAAMRELYHGAYSFAELLYAQVERSEKVPGRPHLWTADVFGETKRSKELGLRGSLEARYYSDDPRVAAQDRKVGCLRGLSVFTMPRLLRYITRSGFKGLRQIDLVNSHFRMLYDLAAELGLLQELACIIAVVERRAEVMEALSERLAGQQLQRDDVKRILLMVLFGGNYRNRTAGAEDPFLDELTVEVRKLASTKNKEILEIS